MIVVPTEVFSRDNFLVVYDRTVRFGSVSAENRDFAEISVRFGSVKFLAEQEPNILVHFQRFLANLITLMNYFLTKHCSISILSLILSNPRQDK